MISLFVHSIALLRPDVVLAECDKPSKSVILSVAESVEALPLGQW